MTTRPTTLNESGMTYRQRELFHTLVDAGCLQSVAYDISMLIE